MKRKAILRTLKRDTNTSTNTNTRSRKGWSGEQRKFCECSAPWVRPVEGRRAARWPKTSSRPTIIPAADTVLPPVTTNTNTSDKYKQTNKEIQLSSHIGAVNLICWVVKINIITNTSIHKTLMVRLNRDRIHRTLSASLNFFYPNGLLYPCMHRLILWYFQQTCQYSDEV